MNNLCKAIDDIDKLIVVDVNDGAVYLQNDPTLNSYCPFKNNLGKHECHGYEEMVISAFIALLTLFKSDGDELDVLEDNKLAEYAILWLSYKLNQKKNIKFKNLKDFYDKYIKDNGNIYNNDITGVHAYNSYKDIINEKINMKTINIKEMSIFYDLLKLLCDIYTEFDSNNSDCTKCSQKANEFVENYKKLNDNCSITGNNSYSQILYTLSTDYKNFKNDCAKKCTNCKDMPTLPKIKTPQNSIECPAPTRVQDKGESPGQGSEAISSGSSVASKLIPILSIFSIPIFLGIAYKYSLFGFDKRFRRQYLREKLKKIKKKINHYI
ncbi:Plasmodium variant antigen protein Cir/Yir/Bir, putative [Plasmodium chabaudi chabaudi]|uniref:Plasmodium variant antigen protein Cir/Yir/Bir, putative n=1 Tax=Plasmodium chabaudi chabaudi TaxID=31271 RepID=A0A1D3L7Y2_PLACU|nr:Plasmodium variant antigen protein Cir/Yir/Bir, putative [Plasmodium chabaudi chabaudi]